ncbi:DNA-binding regulatory protein, YebC/PmpR family [Opisthorchis viverrini]|uniref:DNA-binding regulatory protein, YebC/PmpR family n=1 Tax=Opisthorchis viverrini TaxID=6198 RepID=A0A1S8WMH1_OPIVI|nr:DNA-binding regulatory protein, YebC/PmpR family [Opisthorchis viverrini]
MSFKLAQYLGRVAPAIELYAASSIRWNPLYSMASFTEARRFAGHSHWQNVRHTKEARDKQKSKAAQIYIRAVNNAIKAGGGIRDPKLNSQLASVLAEAKANSVPLSTLERFMKAEFTTDPYFIEVQAPGGLFILIESCAKSVNAERHQIAGIVKRYGCSISPAGKIANEFFDRLAWVCVPGSPASNLTDLDAATNFGIDIGANDVEEVTVDGQIAFKFYCDPSNVEQMRLLLERDHAIQPVSVEDVLVPKCKVQVDSKAYANLLEMYERIRDQHEYVDRIVDNVTVVGDSQRD